MKRVAVFLNPSAGKGKALQKKAKLEKTLRKYEIDYDLFISQSEENLKELTREKSLKYSILVGAGGDSTFNIMANKIIASRADTVLGMIGLGSSNDVAKEFHLDSMERACAAIKSGKTKRIDLGCIVRSRKRLRYYLGQSNIGLGVSVNKYIEELFHKNSKLGKIQILAGALGIIDSYRSRKVPLSLTVSTGIEKFQGHFILTVLNNMRFWATGREISPQARPDDGQLDCILLHECSLSRLAQLVFLSRKGKHLGTEEVKAVQSKEFEISSEIPFEIQTDGEVIGGFRHPERFKEIRFEVAPRALNIIC